MQCETIKTSDKMAEKRDCRNLSDRAEILFVTDWLASYPGPNLNYLLLNLYGPSGDLDLKSSTTEIPKPQGLDRSPCRQ